MNDKGTRSPFGEWLKARRRELGLVGYPLGEEPARAISCSVITIVRTEAGERRPSRDLARMLAQYLLHLEVGNKEGIAISLEGLAHACSAQGWWVLSGQLTTRSRGAAGGEALGRCALVDGGDTRAHAAR